MAYRCSSVAPHGAAIDVDRLAGYPLAAIGHQEKDQLGAFGAVAGVAQWNETLDELFPAFAAAEIVKTKRIDDTGADRVDADTVRREVERHRTAERVNRRLGRGIRRGLGLSDLAGDRRDVDDAAALALRDHFAAGRA